MSTPEPTTPTPDQPVEVTPSTVMADVHTVLDTAKNDAQTAVTGIEHAGLGHLVDDAKQLVAKAFEDLRERLSALIHGAPGADPAVPVQDTPTS